jgi:hypothetical protein
LISFISPKNLNLIKIYKIIFKTLYKKEFVFDDIKVTSVILNVLRKGGQPKKKSLCFGK